MQKGIRTPFVFLRLKTESRIFGRVILKALTSKRLKLPLDNRTDTNFIALLRMRF